MIRANNAERRLANAQNQLAAAEEKMATMNQKTTVADSKWEARVKEYETRLRAAEEKVKRERQGYKERVLELEIQIKCVSCFPNNMGRILISLLSKGPYKDKGNSLTSEISSWPISRLRCRTSRRHQRVSWQRSFIRTPCHTLVFSFLAGLSAYLSGVALHFFFDEFMSCNVASNDTITYQSIVRFP